MRDRDDLNELLVAYDGECPLDEAKTPPSAWYLNRHFLEAEKEAVFEPRWTYAAPAEKLRTPGSWVSGELLGEPWLVVRDTSGALRAFANTCRHHASRLASGEGRSDELVCPYHGWTYSLEGRLLKAPRLGKTRAFDPAECRLHEYEAREFGPFVMIRLRDTRDEFDWTELESVLDADDLRWIARREYSLECNWKVFADNYLDGGYHIPHLHGGLDAQLNMSSYRTRLFDGWSLQTCDATSASPADDASIDPKVRIGREARYAYLYPNFAINRYGPVLDTNWIQPVSPNETRVVFDFWLSAEFVSDEAFVSATLEASESTQLEDVGICREVQKGLASRGFDRGPYASMETGMRQFHQLLVRDLRAHARE